MSVVLKRNIKHVIEAPFLDYKDDEGVRVVYNAHLIDHDDPANNQTSVIQNSTNEDELVYFEFSKEEINKFDDGTKLDIEIWVGDVKMFWKDKEYVVKESYIENDDE